MQILSNEWLTTTSPPKQLTVKLIGDVPSATAILDRFLHRAEIITITGRRYRLKDYPAPAAPPKTRPGKQAPPEEACQEPSHEV